MITDPKSGIRRPWRNWLKQFFKKKPKPQLKQYWTTEQVRALVETLPQPPDYPSTGVAFYSQESFNEFMEMPGIDNYFDPVTHYAALATGYHGSCLGSHVYVDQKLAGKVRDTYHVPADFNPEIVNETNSR